MRLLRVEGEAQHAVFLFEGERSLAVAPGAGRKIEVAHLVAFRIKQRRKYAIKTFIGNIDQIPAHIFAKSVEIKHQIDVAAVAYQVERRCIGNEGATFGTVDNIKSPGGGFYS